MKDSVQHLHPIERRWQITFKKMLDSSNFFGAEVRNYLYIHGRACLEVLGLPDLNSFGSMAKNSLM